MRKKTAKKKFNQKIYYDCCKSCGICREFLRHLLPRSGAVLTQTDPVSCWHDTIDMLLYSLHIQKL